MYYITYMIALVAFLTSPEALSGRSVWATKVPATEMAFSNTAPDVVNAAKLQDVCRLCDKMVVCLTGWRPVPKECTAVAGYEHR